MKQLKLLEQHYATNFNRNIKSMAPFRGHFFCYNRSMGKPIHHDVNYFAQRIESRHNTDIEEMERCLVEIREVIQGIVKGFTLLEKIGKYPDPKVVDNKNRFIELEQQYRERVNELRAE